MKNIDVSFIIPIYNVFDYLPRCLDSIIKQKNIRKEIILVNDGSKDNSLKICLEYADKYPFIKVINKKNEGVSVARNIGLQQADGKYVCFMDGDDFYCEDFAEKFVKLCEENNLDIIRGLYNIYDEEKDLIIKNDKIVPYNENILSGENFLLLSINNNLNEVVPWLGLFKRKYLLENNIFFPEGIAYEEDQLFFLKALLYKKNKVMQTERCFYTYVKRKGSCTAHPKISNIIDACYITAEEIKLINSLVLEENVKKAAYIYASWSFFQVTTLFGKLTSEEQKCIYKKIPSEVMNHAIKYPTSKKNKNKVRLLKYFPKLYVLIFKLIRKEINK
ncbi:glycosyltransferase family 2 protein [Thomasclavelia sp.]